jgi:hypothetical protein
LRLLGNTKASSNAISFPVDSLATLPPISEVCEYFLSKRMEALNRVKDKDLVSVRDVCLSLIKRKIEEVHKSNRWVLVGRGHVNHVALVILLEHNII